MKRLDLNSVEFIEHITKVLKIKPVKIKTNSIYVRKYNTIVRIQNYIDSVDLVSIYSNKHRYILKTDSHYFLDIWVGNDLFTIRCYIKNK